MVGNVHVAILDRVQLDPECRLQQFWSRCIKTPRGNGTDGISESQQIPYTRFTQQHRAIWRQRAEGRIDAAAVPGTRAPAWGWQSGRGWRRGLHVLRLGPLRSRQRPQPGPASASHASALLTLPSLAARPQCRPAGTPWLRYGIGMILSAQQQNAGPDHHAEPLPSHNSTSASQGVIPGPTPRGAVDVACVSPVKADEATPGVSGTRHRLALQFRLALPLPPRRHQAPALHHTLELLPWSSA